MSIVPDTRFGKLEFYEAHLQPWTTHAVAVGLTVPAVAALATATANARAKYDAQVAAQQAAKAATLDFHQAVAAMHSGPSLGADMIQTIKTYAQTTANPGVYVLAEIPPPATPGTTPPPGTPSNFTVALLANGTLKLKWKCSNPPGTNGTIYEVRRREAGEADFSFVGGTGVKGFEDTTLPTGSAPVTYEVTAVRSTARGDAAQFTVNFGTGGGGLAFATVTEGAGMKMAA